MKPVLVVMGVSGCGKTTLGTALAAALQVPFVEGDGLHPQSNVAKMARGKALDDADRLPFLRNVGAALASGHETGVVVSCSALKRTYRDLLRTFNSNCCFVLPVLDRQDLVARLQARKDHFMGVALLDSQVETLELPGNDEQAILVNGVDPVADQVARVLHWLEQQV